MTSLIHYLELFVVPLGAWGVFWACMIEEIVTPIPSALIMMASGFFLLKGAFSVALLSKLIFVVVLPATIGVTLGSFVIYAIGFYGGKTVLDKWGKWFGLSWEDVSKFQNKPIVKKTEVWALFITRATPFIPSTTVAFFCGFIRQKISTYVLITLTGVFIRSFILALMGWYVGEIYGEIAGFGGIVENTILWGLVAVVAVFLIYRRHKIKIGKLQVVESSVNIKNHE